MFVRHDSFLNINNSMKTKVETTNIIFINKRQKEILETKSNEKRLPESIHIDWYKD